MGSDFCTQLPLNSRKWYLRDWNLGRFSLLQGIVALEEIPKLKRSGHRIADYLLRLDYSHGYRRFLLHDNGGELNIEEIGRTNEHFSESLPLPVNGTYAQTNELVIYYRLMQFIENKPIDWTHEDTSMSEEDWQTCSSWEARKRADHKLHHA